MGMERLRSAMEQAQSALNDAMEEAEALEEDGDRDCDCEPDDDARAAAIEAISQIRRGATDDAIVTLERHFLPKWADADEARRAYNESMEASNGTHDNG